MTEPNYIRADIHFNGATTRSVISDGARWFVGEDVENQLAPGYALTENLEDHDIHEEDGWQVEEVAGEVKVLLSASAVYKLAIVAAEIANEDLRKAQEELEQLRRRYNTMSIALRAAVEISEAA